MIIIKIYYSRYPDKYYIEKTNQCDLLDPNNITSSIKKKLITYVGTQNCYDDIETVKEAIRNDDEFIITQIVKKYNEEISKNNYTEWSCYKDGYITCRLSLEDNRKIRSRKYLKDVGYSGGDNDEEIIAFIESLLNKTPRIAVYYCNKCNKFNLKDLDGNTMVCDCGECYDYYDLESTDSRTKLFSNKANAQRAYNELISNNGVTKASNLISYYYKGRQYLPNLYEFYELIKDIYLNYSIYDVFIKDEIPLRFEDSFAKYLKSVLDNNAIEKKSLKDALNVISVISKIRMKSIDDAFYTYFYLMLEVRQYGLIRVINGKKYIFNNIEEYVKELLKVGTDENIDLLKSLLSLFNASTDTKEGFFDGYDHKHESEIYRMIYDYSNIYVYFDGLNCYNFGNNFIENLSDSSSLLIVEKNTLLEIIKSNNKFWNEIKNDFQASDEFGDISKTGNYYDRLCYYQYAILGHKELKYYDYKIEDSREGYNIFKKDIVNCYINNDIKKFNSIIKLCENDKIANKLSKISHIEEHLRILSKDDKVSFNKLVEMINYCTIGKGVPLELFLLCYGKTDKEKIKYYLSPYSKSYTFYEYINNILADSKNIISDINTFLDNEDNITIMKLSMHSKYDKSLDTYFVEWETEFNNLIEAINKSMDIVNTKFVGGDI